MRLARLSIASADAGVALSWPTNYDTGLLEAKDLRQTGYAFGF